MGRILDYDKAKMRQMVATRGSDPVTQPHRPITVAQARFLRKLQRELGEPYIGDELSLGEAKALIDDCLRRLGHREPFRPQL